MKILIVVLLAAVGMAIAYDTGKDWTKYRDKIMTVIQLAVATAFITAGLALMK